MIFETKFDIGDRAWCITHNIATNVVIKSIKILREKNARTYSTVIAYDAVVAGYDCGAPIRKDLLDAAVFKTRSELLDSLFGGRKICRGKNCNAVNGDGHSDECSQEHDQYHIEKEGDMPGFEGTEKDLESLRDIRTMTKQTILR